MTPIATQWIDRYSAEVVRLLPAARRQDIEQEIRSLLMDDAEAMAGDGPLSEADVLTLLKRYPRPEQMAMRYGATTYLIGPLLYPTYLTVLRIVTTVVTVVMVSSILVALFTRTGGDLSLMGVVWSVLQPLFTAAAIVTLVFVAVERGTTASERTEVADARQWNPATLPDIGKQNELKLSDIFTSIVTSLVAILWLNLYVKSDGSMMILADGPTILQLFTPRFLAFIPWLTLLWGADLIVQLVVLARRRWEWATRGILLALNIAGALVLGAMLAGGALSVNPRWESIVDGVVVVVLLLTLFEGIGHLRGLLAMRSPGQPILPAATLTR